MDYPNNMYAKCALALIVVGLVGCAQPGTKTVMLPMTDIEHFREDCKYKQAQLEFLRTQLPTSHTYYAIRDSGSLGAIDSVRYGTYGEKQYVMRGEYQAVIRRKIKSLETWCR